MKLRGMKTSIMALSICSSLCFYNFSHTYFGAIKYFFGSSKFYDNALFHKLFFWQILYKERFFDFVSLDLFEKK